MATKNYKYGRTFLTERAPVIDELLIDDILYTNDSFKLCLIGDEVYMTTPDFVALHPSHHMEDISEEYISRFVTKEDYLENNNSFIEAYEVFKGFTTILIYIV